MMSTVHTKYLVATISIIFLSFNLNAQELMRSTLSSTGGSKHIHHEGQRLLIQHSIGQKSAIVGNKVFTGHTIRQGFIQPPFKFSQSSLLNSDLGISVYPNPVFTDLYLTYQDEIKGDLILYLFDSGGHLIDTQIYSENSLSTLPVKHLPTGTYWLRLVSNEAVQTIQFVKL